jgi:hypothetical protein
MTNNRRLTQYTFTHSIVEAESRRARLARMASDMPEIKARSSWRPEDFPI